MRHIDVRADWVKQLRDRSVCKIVKIPGVDNIADGLTKILSRPAFQEWEQKVMQRIFEPNRRLPAPLTRIGAVVTISTLGVHLI